MTTPSAGSSPSLTTTRVRLLAANVGVLLLGVLTAIALFYVSAHLDIETPRTKVAQAFEDGTLSYDTFRLLEPVPGFIVAENDANSSCVMYSQMLAPSSTVFGLGVWSDPFIPTCEGLAVAVRGGEVQDVSWFRYWHGASAITKIALTFVSVYAWQLILTGVIVILLALLTLSAWRFSRTFAVGLAVTAFMTTDLPWQGLSAVHGVSASLGLLFCLLALHAFARTWRVRWGIVALAGALYAMVAQMLIPMAFAILVAMMAMLPLLRGGSVNATRRLLVGPIVALLWVVGYAVGLLSRYVWAVIDGPGLSVLRGEVSATSNSFVTKGLLDPLYQVVGLLTKTWLDVGWMQLGLMVFFVVLGWSLARGGARGLLSRPALVSFSPVLLGLAWLAIWATHTNHTFVHVLLAVMLLNLLFMSEVGRTVTRVGETADDVDYPISDRVHT